jgi:dihydrofolate synthase/folylpolyglutamate synthase
VSAKDITGILEILAPLASRILLCPVATPRAAPATELAACLPADAPSHEIFPDFEAAFTAAQQSDEPILITGSLFLVGEARAFLTSKTFQSSSQ